MQRYHIWSGKTTEERKVKERFPNVINKEIKLPSGVLQKLAKQFIKPPSHPLILITSAT
jgi:hypothetical protein